MSQKEQKVTPRAVRKRKISEVDLPSEEPAVGNGNSESEVQSIIAETPSAARGRPRRRIVAAERTPPAPAPRRGRKPNKQKVEEDAEYDAEADAPEDEDDADEQQEDADEEDEEGGPSNQPTRKSVRQRRPSKAALAQESPRRASRARKPQASSSLARSAPSTPKRKRGRPRKVPASPQNKPHRAESDDEADAQGETDLDAEGGGEAMQVDTGADADVEDEAPMAVEHATALTTQASVEVPSSDVQEQDQALLTASQAEDDALAREQSPEIPLPSEIAAAEHAHDTPSSKIPAHRARASHPRVKRLDDTVRDDGPTGISTKARIKKRMSQDDGAGPSTGKTNSKAKATNGSTSKRVKPGPGRSSSGFQLGSSSLFTVVKKGAVGALRKVGVMSAANGPAESTDEDGTAAEVPAVPATTSEQSLHAAELDAQASASVPGVTEASEHVETEEQLEPEPQAKPSGVLSPYVTPCPTNDSF